MRKRPEKTAQTKADLEQAFWLLFSEGPAQKNPLESITVQQVCDRAGYNRGTFYLHFESLPELLDGIEAQQLEGMCNCTDNALRHVVAAPDGGALSKLALVGVLTDVMRYYEKNKTYVKAFLGDQRDPAFLEKLKARLKPLWRQHVIGAETKRSEDEVDLILEHTLTGMLSMVSLWLKGENGVLPAEMGRLVYDMAIRDVRKRVNA